MEGLGFALAVLAANADLKEVQAVRHFALRRRERLPCRRRTGQLFIQPFVHGGVERMAGAEQNGVEVLVLVEMVFVEGDLAIGGSGLPSLRTDCSRSERRSARTCSIRQRPSARGSTFRPTAARL